jgi:hypothetical protein
MKIAIYYNKRCMGVKNDRKKYNEHCGPHQNKR